MRQQIVDFNRNIIITLGAFVKNNVKVRPAREPIKPGSGPFP